MPHKTLMPLMHAVYRKNIDINDGNDARGYLYLLLPRTHGMLRLCVSLKEHRYQ